MNESRMERDDQLKRYERLQHLYEILVQLVMHEGRFVSERTNNFLLFNSILFTGFLILSTQIGNINAWITALKVALPAVGLVMTVLHSISIARTMDAADFWRSSIGLIEQDPDFWYPTKAERDLDLDIFRARRRYLDGIQTQQQQHALRLSQPPGFIKKLSSHLPNPNRIFVFWLPSLVGILWLLALVWSCIQLIDSKTLISFGQFHLTRCLWFAALTQILLRKTSQIPIPLGDMANKIKRRRYNGFNAKRFGKSPKKLHS